MLKTHCTITHCQISDAFDIVLAETFDQKCLTYIYSKRFNLNTLKCNVKKSMSHNKMFCFGFNCFLETFSKAFSFSHLYTGWYRVNTATVLTKMQVIYFHGISE